MLTVYVTLEPRLLVPVTLTSDAGSAVPFTLAVTVVKLRSPSATVTVADTTPPGLIVAAFGVVKVAVGAVVSTSTVYGCDTTTLGVGAIESVALKVMV